MAYKQNATAIGTYPCAQHVGERDASGRWTGELLPCPSLPFAAYDRAGDTWRVTEAEAAEINARREAAKG